MNAPSTRRSESSSYVHSVSPMAVMQLAR